MAGTRVWAQIFDVLQGHDCAADTLAVGWCVRHAQRLYTTDQHAWGLCTGPPCWMASFLPYQLGPGKLDS